MSGSVTGKFQADFQDFYSALTKAQVELRTFSTGAADVERKLTTMGNSLNGAKVIQDAHLMSAAIVEVGGVSTLTDKELTRVAATVAEASEKMRKLGQEVPPGFQKITDAANAIKPATDAAGGSFGQLGTSFTKLVGSFVSAQVILGAVKQGFRLVSDEVVALTIHGAAVADVTDNFTHLTGQAGRLGSELLGSLKAGTHQTVTDFELMKTVNQDLGAGLNLSAQQFGTMSKGAFALAQATGVDVKEALDTMNDAMLTGKTRAIALLTGKIDLGKAEEKYAASIGTTRDALNDAGKLEAARASILDSVGAATQRLGEQTDGLDEKLAQVQTAWADFENDLGRTIATSPVIAGAIDAIGKAFTDAFGSDQQQRVQGIADFIDTAAVSMLDFGQTVISAGGFAIKEVYATKIVFGDLAQILDGVLVSVETLAAGFYRLNAATTFGETSKNFTKQADDLSASVVKTVDAMKERATALHADEKAQDEVDVKVAALNASFAASVKSIEATRVATIAHRDATAAVIGPMERVTAAQAEARGEGEQFTKETEKQKKAVEDFKKSLTELAIESDKVFKGLVDGALLSVSAIQKVNSLGIGPGKIGSTADGGVSHSGLPTLKGGVSFGANTGSGGFAGITAGPVKIGKQISDGISTSVFDGLNTALPKSILAAIQGGGSVPAAAAGTIGSGIAQNFVTKFGTKIEGVFGKTFGGAISSALPIVGALAGPAITALINLFGDHAGKDMKKAGLQMGVSLSDGLVSQLKNDSKKYGGEVQAIAVDLSKIIGEAGGLNAGNLTSFTGKLHDVFSLVETHQLSVSAGAKILDENFTNFAAAGTNNLGLLDKKLVDIIALNDKFGTQSKEIAGYVAGQMTAAEKGLGAALSVTQDAYIKRGQLKIQFADITAKGDEAEIATIAKIEKLQSQLDHESSSAQRAKIQSDIDQLMINEKLSAQYVDIRENLKLQDEIIQVTKLHSQDAASAVGAALSGTVEANMAAGMSFIDAVRGVGPDIEKLRTELANTGYTGGAAFDFLASELALANDQIAGPALQSIEGYTAGIVGLSNAGQLTQETFSGIAGQIGATEAALVAHGASSGAVMVAIRGDLQTIWEMQQRYGYSVDDSTQALIDQGVESGLIGEQGKTDNQKILDVLMAIGEALGATIPDGLKTMSGAGAAAAKQLQADMKKAASFLEGDPASIAAGSAAVSAQLQADMDTASAAALTDPKSKSLVAAALKAGQTLKDQIADAASKANASLAGITRDITVGIHTRYDSTGTPDFAGSSPTFPDQSATGSLITGHGLEHFREGGIIGSNVLPWPDTRLIAGQDGEMILNANQQKAVSALLGRGGGGRGGNNVVDFEAMRGELRANREAFNRLSETLEAAAMRGPEQTVELLISGLAQAGIGRRR